MTELLTAAQMKAIEAEAIASGRVTGLELMECAGRGVVDAIFAEWPELAASSFRAVVLCGPGGNGGDGFVVARLLKEWGWEVAVFLYGTPERMPPDARVNYERWRAMGEVGAIADAVPPTCADLVVDALFGIGLTRPMPDELVAFVDGVVGNVRLNGPDSRTRLVAVDTLSGVCADSGKVLGQPAPYFADLTVTFQRAKLGHYLGDGGTLSWALRCVDIGIDDFAGSGSVALAGLSARRIAKRRGHKFGHGHALVLSGGVGHGGAARLAAGGALRIGAGLVTLLCPPAALIENAARLDAVMLKPIKDAAGLAAVLADKRINALCIGPGLGVERAAGMLAVVLGNAARSHPFPEAEGSRPDGEVGAGDSAAGGNEALPPSRLEGGQVGGFSGSIVIDADGITALTRDPALFARLHKNCVLTPHGGEFARLFPDIAAKLEAPATKGPAYSKVDATREAAKRAGCVVLFKGADTVIAAPDGRCSVNSAHYDRAAPWLATAGSGDVLAGFITGLLARGFAPMQAAEAAAWLHVECARSFGPGLIAEDLSAELPKVFRALGL